MGIIPARVKKRQAGPGTGRERMKKSDPTISAGDAVSTQYAALCYRWLRGKEIEVLLITSRDTGRWVIPKGWPVEGKDGAGSATVEAFEEAGVEGEITGDCIGLFSYDKTLGPKQEIPVVVAVYPLEVRKMLTDFPERKERELRWFAPKKAAQKVDEPELAALIRDFVPRPPKAKGAKQPS